MVPTQAGSTVRAHCLTDSTTHLRRSVVPTGDSSTPLRMALHTALCLIGGVVLSTAPTMSSPVPTVETPGTHRPGVIIYSKKTPGGTEHYIAGTWEENELMKAEATMYANNFSLSSINTAMGIIDAIRVYQGAGIPAVTGVVTTQAAAKEELRKERRVALIFRGLSFYDARRWKVIDPIASGGGRTGAVVLSGTGVVSTNATIEYNFLDYWDVPDNELAYDPPAAGSAPVKNPRQ